MPFPQNLITKAVCQSVWIPTTSRMPMMCLCTLIPHSNMMF